MVTKTKTPAPFTLDKGEDGTWKFSLPETAELNEDTPETAELEQRGGFLDAIADIQVAGIPFGEAALGGASAVLVTEVVDGIVRSTGIQGATGLVAKVAAALALIQFGPNIIGKRASTLGAAFIAFDTIRQLVPIDQSIRNIVSGFTGGIIGTAAPTPTGTLAQNPNNGQPGNDAVGLPELVRGRLALAGL